MTKMKMRLMVETMIQSQFKYLLKATYLKKAKIRKQKVLSSILLSDKVVKSTNDSCKQFFNYQFNPAYRSAPADLFVKQCKS